LLNEFNSVEKSYVAKRCGELAQSIPNILEHVNINQNPGFKITGNELHAQGATYEWIVNWKKRKRCI
jgi:hypothetical protein